MHTRIHSATVIGLHAHLINVEVDMDETSAKASFVIVGMPSTAIKESRKRIITALKNSGYQMPNRSITINLNPADLRKDGALFDLPIALGILKAAGALNVSANFLQDSIIVGELSLDGTINPIKGALAISSDAENLGKNRIILPALNSKEASLVDIEVIGVSSLQECIGYIESKLSITTERTSIVAKNEYASIDFDDVKGQEYAKRALQIAAAGRHNFLFSGPPGSGKTMLAKRILTIMPDMSFDEIIETTKIYSICGKLDKSQLITSRPFRSPHHSTSRIAIVGGGVSPQPGEISLAHNGVLFLDEVTEFNRETLEALREPLENRFVNISRINQQVVYPSSFLLIAAYNPCPCGFHGDPIKKCTCSPSTIKNYQNKLSGPLLDRIDIRIGLRAIEYHEATIQRPTQTNMSSKNLKIGIMNAIDRQHKRFGNYEKTNSMMSSVDVEKYCTLTPKAESIIKKAFVKLSLSMRAYHKTLKLARTIADLSDEVVIQDHHIAEALVYKFEQT